MNNVFLRLEHDAITEVKVLIHMLPENLAPHLVPLD